MWAWTRARRLPLAAALAAFATLALLAAAGRHLPLPEFLVNFIPVPLAPLSGLFVAAALSVFAASAQAPERAAVRLLLTFEYVVVIALTCIPAAVCLLLEATNIATYGAATARNCLGLAGMALIARLRWPRTSAILPTTFTLICALFGRVADQNPELWAWPLAAATNLWSWIWSAAWIIAGLAALPASWRNTTHR